MTSSLQILDPSIHAGLRLGPVNDHAFAANLTFAPLAGMEVAAAASCYPLVFLPEGPALPHALLGFDGVNTYLNARGQWQAPYIPAVVRRHPFAAVQAGEDAHGQPRWVLAVDMASPRLQNNEGELLVTPAGEFTALVKQAGEFSQQLQNQMNASAAALAELEERGVLVDKVLTLNDGKTARAFGGFRVVDAGKLAALDDATLARWARNGVLQIVHAHLDSLRHLQAVAEASVRPLQTH